MDGDVSVSRPNKSAHIIVKLSVALRFSRVEKTGNMVQKWKSGQARLNRIFPLPRKICSTIGVPAMKKIFVLISSPDD